MYSNTRLLTLAGVMMLLVGCIMAFIHRWLYAALMLAMAFGLLAGTLSRHRARRTKQGRFTAIIEPCGHGYELGKIPIKRRVVLLSRT